MAQNIRNIQEDIIDEGNDLLLQKNVSIPINGSDYPIRCNIYRPLCTLNSSTRLPVIMTYGPYGKDVPYEVFHPDSFSELNVAQKSPYSAWETPDPCFWCGHGYILLRCYERGFGHSPGRLHSMSADTANAFCQAIEWAADQPWSTGKVGLLGVSYFAGTQWRVAARAPRGLACIIPWEGMSDYYRDRCRHGGILSNEFIQFWWNRQVITNQYGRPGRAARSWGDDTIEGNLTAKELENNRCDQTQDNVAHRFRDESYYASRDFALEQIKVPLLSVANWGGIGLHLRGNVQGFMYASSEFKYLRFIVGRHDLPFYYNDEVEIQRSFLDAWLKNQDRTGWTRHGEVAPVSLVLRKGDLGYNNERSERRFPRREETEWPITRTQYTPYYLTRHNRLQPGREMDDVPARITYAALGSIKEQQKINFTSAPFETATEITGHIVAHLNVSLSASEQGGTSPCDIDLFVTLRHWNQDGKEVLYTGTIGDPVPIVKGWLRCSLRRTRPEHPKHRDYLPYREYFQEDEELLHLDKVYAVDVEIWPTSVVMDRGDLLEVEISSGDTDGSGLFLHQDATDRDPKRFAGLNHIHFGKDTDNYVILPIIPLEG